MITLNGIVLPDDLYIKQANNGLFSQNIDYTLGGKPIVNTMKLYGGDTIEVFGNEDSGWIKYSTLKELENDYNQNYNNILILDFNGTIYNVMYAQPYPLDFNPIIEKPTYNDDDYFYGKIKLIKF